MNFGLVDTTVRPRPAPATLGNKDAQPPTRPGMAPHRWQNVERARRELPRIRERFSELGLQRPCGLPVLEPVRALPPAPARPSFWGSVYGLFFAPAQPQPGPICDAADLEPATPREAVLRRELPTGYDSLCRSYQDWTKVLKLDTEHRADTAKFDRYDREATLSLWEDSMPCAVAHGHAGCAGGDHGEHSGLVCAIPKPRARTASTPPSCPHESWWRRTIHGANVRLDAALDWYEGIFEAGPFRPGVWQHRDEHIAGLEAFTGLQGWLIDGSRWAELQLLLGHAYMATRDFARARGAFSVAAQQDSTLGTLGLLGLGHANMFLGDYRASRRAYADVKRRAPNAVFAPSVDSAIAKLNCRLS